MSEKNNTVYFLLADGFEEVEALLPLDILRRAGIQALTVGIKGKSVCGAHGIVVIADLVPEEAIDAFSMLVLPGGMPGSKNLDASPVTDHFLSIALHTGARIAAICAAPIVLGHRGLLKGKEAVCFPGYEKDLAGALLSNKRVVTDGLFTTAIGMGAAAEFAFSLLALLKDRKTADSIRDAALFKQ